MTITSTVGITVHMISRRTFPSICSGLGFLFLLYLITKNTIKKVTRTRRTTRQETINRKTLSIFEAVFEIFDIIAGPFVNPYRYQTSTKVSPIITVNVRIAMKITPLIKAPSYLRCMKYVRTSSALQDAIARHIRTL